MIKTRSDATANAISEALCGTKALNEACRKAAAESFVENLDRVVVGVVASCAQRDHVDAALIYVFFLDLVEAGLRGLELDFGRLRRRAFLPIAKSASYLRFHLSSIEVP